ncbi:universal stress protein [Nitrosopumilus sp. K4]|uniref:universal stress protein n=1 Tax=Nitrosopumilus sp. K4 TaxID=2795383 RepID=UPI001BA9E243|nr:universal stress protein [Nitrosopumilus sp. K4]QUC65526.1 universal stress protein [Nitrosopumilus sp. K4]
MIKKILVPYDFTKFADTAFEKAVEIAEKFDAEVILLTVIGGDVDTSGMSFSRAQEVQDEREDKTKQDLEMIKNSGKYQDLNISVEIINNPSTVDGIIGFVDKNNIDLIVMGSHGRSGVKKLVLGSVASEVTTKANCQVLIAKLPKSKN